MGDFWTMPLVVERAGEPIPEGSEGMFSSMMAAFYKNNYRKNIINIQIINNDKIIIWTLK
jgi:hypothetical protein